MPETEFLETAIEAAHLGGGILLEWTDKFTASEKGRADLVTEADLASQEAIHQLIRSRFPDHNFLGEEGLCETNSDSPYRWIIDPLDGTSNYVHHFPYYGVSIGLQRGTELVAGVVFDPNRDETFTAIRGSGAHMNGEPLATTRVAALANSMVVASLPVGARPENVAVDRFLRVMRHAQTVQRTGSAALNLAYVAAGRMEAYWSSSLKPWDMAAGVLIVEEAGGRVSRMDGGVFDVEIPDLLASNGTGIHGELQALLD